MADQERDELAARQAKPDPVTPQGFQDTQARNDQAHCARQLVDASRHPITRLPINVSK
jgi:hypothetical protein